MANKVFQNMDLVREIYSYGDPSHRESMREVLRLSKGVPVSYVLKTYRYSPKDAYLKESLTEFFLLRRCRCCSRHAHNTPQIHIVHDSKKKEWLVFDYRTMYFPECNNHGDCDCNCRHRMRILAQFIYQWSCMDTHKIGPNR